MKSKRHEIFKGLIKKADLDSPPVNFTSLVMEQVQEESKNEFVIDPVLQQLLKRNAVINAPQNLTHLVMSQVKILSISKPYKPIIGTKAWLIISTTVAMLIVCLILIDKYSTTSQRLSSHYINISNELNAILHLLYSIPTIYIITIISFSVLFIMDYLLKRYFHEKVY